MNSVILCSIVTMTLGGFRVSDIRCWANYRPLFDNKGNRGMIQACGDESHCFIERIHIEALIFYNKQSSAFEVQMSSAFVVT